MFDSVFTTAISLRAKIYQTASEIIFSAQEKQRRDYNRCHQVPNKFQVSQKVLLKNQRRMKRRGGKRRGGKRVCRIHSSFDIK